MVRFILSLVLAFQDHVIENRGKKPNEHEKELMEIILFSQTVSVCVCTCKSISMVILTCPHKNEGDIITGCKSISPASRAIFVCLFESVKTGDEIIMEIISFKILHNINLIRNEQIAGADHLPKAE